MNSVFLILINTKALLASEKWSTGSWASFTDISKSAVSSAKQRLQVIHRSDFVLMDE